MQSAPIKVPICPPVIEKEDVEEVSSAVSSGWISGRGKYVQSFEQQFSSWMGVKNVVCCSSGTAALHLALVALGIKPNDEVIIPAFSMGAVPFSVAYTGAKIILVDSELATWNMDPNLVARKITPRTKAIIAMHTYGHMVDMGPIIDSCKSRREIKIVEDAAEAHGAEWLGRKAGSLGVINCFSFFANKIITTGEGGAVVTDNDELAERSRSLRDMAFSRNLSKKFLHEDIGFNYRMTNMQAALGTAQLRRIETFISARRRNANIYNSLLSKIRGITTHPEATWAKNVYWMYSILVDAEEFGMSRDELMSKLSERGIETRPFFVPVNLQPVFRSDYSNQSYPNSEYLGRCGINLPSGNSLTREQVEYVAAEIGSLQRR